MQLRSLPFPIRCYVGLVLTVLLIGLSVLMLRAEGGPGVPLPPLATCQADLFSHRTALVEWQMRALAAEYKLAQIQGPQAAEAVIAERTAWEQALRQELKIPATATFDQVTKTFIKQE